MAQHTRDRYRAGMPQLARNGLSENWLLKECGDRHWHALAAATGHAVPDFVDDDGERAYAAFTAVSVHDARLDEIGENAMFEIDTSLVQSGAARHFSEHRLWMDGALHARVSMCSAFVRRREAGNNQSVVRARFAALDAAVEGVPHGALTMARLGKRLRSGEWGDELGVAQPPAHDASAIRFDPCPNGDFNGADFLYFASFQAFVDRAEWTGRCFATAPALARRDLFYYGNLNVGDTLSVRTLAQRSNERELAHWCEIRRGSDRVKIADVVTVKRWVSA